jgi:RimJ/RimL family protein N-acetyltransferase
VIVDDPTRWSPVALRMDDGTQIRVRPIVPSDKPLLADGMRHLSPESRYRRFFTSIETLSPALLVRLTEIDYADHFAWLVVIDDEGCERAIAVGRYIRLPDDPTCAEVAITVRDDYQGRGLGTMLLQLLGRVALEHGITSFTAVVLPENSPMRALLQDEGITLHFDPDAGALRGTGPIAIDTRTSDLTAQFVAQLDR